MHEHSKNARPLLQDLERMAIDTFETSEDASEWLRRPHPMLDDMSPLEMSQTEGGTQRVMAILVAIKYGGVL